ncbi:hypothetical protein TTRE_0000235201 [Trichuris trichiura]|uniref:Uncharacterized protein n=1 Tax=Trichuris trichiura TaxID=36087 RepID=A0A077Z321_TRITR|nr:hypothetical protein TTRE_0000235201 [Trichuris trichiura]
MHLKTAAMESGPYFSNQQSIRTKEDRKAATRKGRSTKGKMRSAMLAFQNMMKMKASKFSERLKGRSKPKKLFDDEDVPMPGFSATLTPKAWDMETSTMKKTKKAHSTSSNLKKKKSKEKKRSLRIDVTKSEREVFAGERMSSGTKRVLSKTTETEEPTESVATQSCLPDPDEETDEDDDKTSPETKRQPKK